MSTAAAVDTRIAMITIITNDPMKLLSQYPELESLVEATNPDMAPSMNTSPWAKLMKPKTP